MQFTLKNIYTWTNLDKKIWEWILLEKRDHWLQFSVFAEDMCTLDGYMMVNTNKVQYFSSLPARKIEPVIPEKSLEKKSFQDTMRDGILCEIVGEIDGLLEDEWDLFFENGEYRLYPIRRDGTYEDGYLPLQEDHIASVYYGNAYLENLEALARERGDV